MKFTIAGVGPAGLATAAVCLCLLAGRADAGTWTELSNINPYGTGQEILLDDGSVLFDNASMSVAILHPDASGNYANGTFTAADPGNWYSLYAPSATLNDGTWMRYGGEYNPGNESASEIYSTATGAWRIGISPISSNVYDTFNSMLANGMVINSSLYGPAQVEEYNWQTSSWSPLAAATNWGDEANVELLPDGDMFDPMWSQQYVPGTNSWITLPGGPISDTGDPGPSIELYNGQVMVENTQNQIEFYIPSSTPGVAGTWSTQVVTLAGGDLFGDYQSSLEPNGNVLIGAGNDVYELNPTTYALTSSATGNYGLYGDIITLPNGQLLVNNGGNNAWIYTPTGTPTSSWRPTVTSVGGSGPFTLTGTQLFGLSQCGSDSDDRNSSTNYPIVYLKSGTNVWYCRTYSYSTRSIAAGSTAETCQFSLPAGLASGSYSLYVTVNGISSATAYSFTAPASPAVCAKSGQVYLMAPSSGLTAYMNVYQKSAGTSPIDCTNSPTLDNNDSWTFVQKSNGSYTISNGGEGSIVLDGNGSSGAVIERSGYNGGINEEWKFTPVAGGYYEITNQNTGLCLDGGTSPSTYTTIVQDTYTGATGQKWALTVVNGMNNAAPVPTIFSGSEYVLTPTSNGTAAMNSYSGGTTVGQPPIDCTNAVNQDDYWTLTQNSNSTYTFKDDGGLVLDGNGVTTSGNVIENTSNSSANQQWNLASLGSGLYEITNKTSGLALDAGTTAPNLQHIVQDAYTGATGQKWRLFDGTLNGYVVTYEPGMIPDWNAGNTGVPQQVNLTQNGSISFPVTVIANTANGGAVGTVTFSAANLPPGITASFSPASITGAGTTTCTLTDQPGSVQPNGIPTPAGMYTVDISGTGSGISAGITEGQDMHVIVLGSALPNGTYSPVSVGQMHWPAQNSSAWQYTSIDDYGGSGPIVSQCLQYTNVNQQWTLTQVGSYYKMIDGAGLALTASSASALTQIAYTGATNQLWSLTPSGVGFMIKSDAYGTALDANSSTWVTALALDTATGAATQQWVFTSNTSN